MPLSLNEIRKRASAFSKRWENESSEDAEAKTFWDEFFQVFGVDRKRFAAFEKKVKKLDGKDGFIDLLWKGTVLVEHKSRSKDLTKAHKQATEYFPGLKDHELPRYIIVCDFYHFKLYNLETEEEHAFTLDKLVDNIHLFDFLSNYKRHSFAEQNPVNIAAAELMGKLHDELKAIGYEGHDLELYLVRLLFLLFADDTNIFEKGIFYELILQRTAEDGSDLAGWLQQLFEVLNTPEEKRFKNLDDALKAFPYVNGKLFEERLPHASFDSTMRQYLLQCSALDWSNISPAIFGSLFQSVMDEKARRNLGAHYTSEKNILKVIKPLFLDELYEEFNTVKSNARQLDQFHIKLSTLRFLDPACGCGNFLIIAYRELRLLEIDVIRHKFRNQMATNVDAYINVNVDQFYGIEYEEFPAQIAQVAMWLIDHQMNMKVSQTFGEYFVRLPLRKSATIMHGNALRVDWQSLLQEGERYNYILGNPPFLGHHYQNQEQKKDMATVFQGVDGYGVLDYVSCWYMMAAKVLANTKNYEVKKTVCAFVSTSSIVQGEQLGLLWNALKKYQIKIHFAHRTFKWANEARGNAAVHVVIVGFSDFDIDKKRIFDYIDIKGEPKEIVAKNISPYLVDSPDVIIQNRRDPICNVPRMIWGNKPTDGGNLLFDNKESKDDFIALEPEAARWIRPYMSGDDFLQNRLRYCLWLKSISPTELNKLPQIKKRVQAVKETRLASKASATRAKAEFPTLFAQIAQPETDYLAIPEVSSERRKYVPIAYVSKNVIASNKIQMVPNATLFQFGIITSLMHMIWMKFVCGRLESRFSYSNTIVYNNFPWPESPTPKQKEAVEKAAQGVLDARAQFANASLADLYDPNTMPRALTRAHLALDKAVDLCYRPQPFPSETKRIEYLFELYDKYTSGLFVEEKKGKKKK